MASKRSITPVLVVCLVLFPRILMSGQDGSETFASLQESGLSIFDTRTAELYIPSLKFESESLEIRLLLDAEESDILTLVNAQFTEVQYTVSALFDSTGNIAHVPYAAVFNGSIVEKDRFSLKLQLIEEEPNIRLRIIEKQQHHLTIATVLEGIGNHIDVIAGSATESIVVIGDPTSRGNFRASASAVITTEIGAVVSVFADDLGRPLALVSGDVIFVFSDYSANDATLSLVDPRGQVTEHGILFASLQMDALQADFLAMGIEEEVNASDHASAVNDTNTIQNLASRTLSYGAHLLTVASCMVSQSAVVADMPELLGQLIGVCGSSVLGAARVQAVDSEVVHESLTCSGREETICTPFLSQFEDRLDQALQLIAGSGIFNVLEEVEPQENTNPIWLEIPDSRLADSLYDWSSQGGAPGVLKTNGIYAFSGAAFDTKRNRLLIHGGGHGDYGGQEVYAFDVDTFNWSLIAPPDRKAALRETDCTVPEQENYGRRTANNFPKSVHTYDRLVYVEQLDALLDGRGSVAFRECRGPNKEAALWNFETNKWEWWSEDLPHSDDSPYPAQYAFGGVGAAAAVHPLSKEIWFVPQSDGGRLTRWNPTTGDWAQGRVDNHAYSTRSKVAVIDTARNNLIVGIAGSSTSSLGMYIVPLEQFEEGETRLQDYLITTSGDNAFLDDRGGRRISMDYDPVGDQLVAWAGYSDIYILDLDNLEWKRHPIPGAAPGSASTAGTYGRFRYVASIDKFILTPSTTENVYLLDLRADSESPAQTDPTPEETSPPEPTPPEPTAPGDTSPITTFELTSVTTNAQQPFTTAVAFAEGDVVATPTLDLENYQVEIKKYWHDGSVKHAVFSGFYSSSAGVPTQVNVHETGEISEGAMLTMADVVEASPTATVQIGNIGTVSLAELLDSPTRIWLQGSEMIEAHFVTDIGSNPTIVVKFQVRLYANGAMRIRAIVENGLITDSDTAGDPTDIYYAPLVTIGGEIVYDNDGNELYHHHHTRWSVESWVNIANPETTVKHDTAYLTSTRLVPNYWKPAPEDILNEYDRPYVPMKNGAWRQSMGNPGWSDQIGILPSWDAVYLTSGGDARAYRAVESNAKALNSYGIIWADPATFDPILLSNWSSWTVRGENGGGSNGIRSGPYSWSVSHHGSGGYFAYLLTGDYYYLETMQHQTAANFLITWSYRGLGTARRVLSTQTRSGAWAIRTIGQAVAISPDSEIASDFREWLQIGVGESMVAILDLPGLNESGYIYTHCAAGGETMCYSSNGFGGVGSFQQNFLVQSVGYVSHLKPLADMSDLLRVRNHLYKIPVGLTGGAGADQYCYTKAGAYDLQISPVIEAKRSPEIWFDSWGDIYEATWGEANIDCGTVLEHNGRGGGSVLEASKGHWGNFLPALSYAVEDGAPGAAEGWLRIQNADNFTDFENSGFGAQPMYGIVPRGYQSQ